MSAFGCWAGLLGSPDPILDRGARRADALPIPDTKCQAQKGVHSDRNSNRQLRCQNKLSQCNQEMVDKGTSDWHVGLCSMARYADPAHGYKSHVGPQATVLSCYHTRPVRGLTYVRLRSIVFMPDATPHDATPTAIDDCPLQPSHRDVTFRPWQAGFPFALGTKCTPREPPHLQPGRD